MKHGLQFAVVVVELLSVLTVFSVTSGQTGNICSAERKSPGQATKCQFDELFGLTNIEKCHPAYDKAKEALFLSHGDKCVEQGVTKLNCYAACFFKSIGVLEALEPRDTNHTKITKNSKPNKRGNGKQNEVQSHPRRKNGRAFDKLSEIVPQNEEIDASRAKRSMSDENNYEQSYSSQGSKSNTKSYQNHGIRNEEDLSQYFDKETTEEQDDSNHNEQSLESVNIGRNQGYRQSNSNSNEDEFLDDSNDHSFNGGDDSRNLHGKSFNGINIIWNQNERKGEGVRDPRPTERDFNGVNVYWNQNQGRWNGGDKNIPNSKGVHSGKVRNDRELHNNNNRNLGEDNVYYEDGNFSNEKMRNSKDEMDFLNQSKDDLTTERRDERDLNQSNEKGQDGQRSFEKTQDPPGYNNQSNWNRNNAGINSAEDDYTTGNGWRGNPDNNNGNPNRQNFDRGGRDDKTGNGMSDSPDSNNNGNPNRQNFDKDLMDDYTIGNGWRGSPDNNNGNPNRPNFDKKDGVDDHNTGNGWRGRPDNNNRNPERQNFDKKDGVNDHNTGNGWRGSPDNNNGNPERQNFDKKDGVNDHNTGNGWRRRGSPDNNNGNPNRQIFDRNGEDDYTTGNGWRGNPDNNNGNPERQNSGSGGRVDLNRKVENVNGDNNNPQNFGNMKVGNFNDRDEGSNDNPQNSNNNEYGRYQNGQSSGKSEVSPIQNGRRFDKDTNSYQSGQVFENGNNPQNQNGQNFGMGINDPKYQNGQDFNNGKNYWNDKGNEFQRTTSPNPTRQNVRKDGQKFEAGKDTRLSKQTGSNFFDDNYPDNHTWENDDVFSKYITPQDGLNFEGRKTNTRPNFDFEIDPSSLKGKPDPNQNTSGTSLSSVVNDMNRNGRNSTVKKGRGFNRGEVNVGKNAHSENNNSTEEPRVNSTVQKGRGFNRAKGHDGKNPHSENKDGKEDQRVKGRGNGKHKKENPDDKNSQEVDRHKESDQDGDDTNEEESDEQDKPTLDKPRKSKINREKLNSLIITLFPGNEGAKSFKVIKAGFIKCHREHSEGLLPPDDYLGECEKMKEFLDCFVEVLMCVRESTGS